MSLKNAPVPMPTQKITFKPAPDGGQYAYYTVRAYRNDKGQPTSRQVAIGKKDSESGMLIPNKKYFQIFHNVIDSSVKNCPDNAVKVRPKRVRTSGTTAALTEIASQTGLLEILKACFPATWGQILACAMYMICEHKAMMYIEDWFDETAVSNVSPMDDMGCSQLFASITEDDRAHFFEKWIQHRNEQEYITYDVTSVSTYAENMEIAEWGYNRDGDSLCQVNLGMYYGVSSSLPVYYNLYSGSIPDKNYLDFMMTDAKSLGIQKVCFVFDGGFITEGNLKSLRKKGYTYIAPLPKKRLDAVRLVEETKTTIRKSANYIAEAALYAVHRPLNLYGLDIHAYIYYDPEKQVLDEKELYAHIEKMQSELAKMSKTKRISRRYNDFFVINQTPNDSITFEINAEKVDELLERTGFFILISDQPNMSASEILELYRKRDTIEKCFSQLKNQMDFKRMRTHYRKTTDGKMFVGFLALILRSHMLHKLKCNRQLKTLTLEKILIELRKIKSVTMSDSSTVSIPLTKLQKTILTLFDVQLNLFESPTPV